MMKGQMAGLMQQAQKMQENMKRMQDQLAATEVEGQSGAGMVKVTMTCKYDVRRVAIDPSLVGDDKEMLEDLVAAAFNDAVRRAEDVCSKKWRRLRRVCRCPRDSSCRFSDAPSVYASATPPHVHLRRLVSGPVFGRPCARPETTASNNHEARSHD